MGNDDHDYRRDIYEQVPNLTKNDLNFSMNTLRIRTTQSLF
jgi:hypothetical protein